MLEFCWSILRCGWAGMLLQILVLPVSLVTSAPEQGDLGFPESLPIPGMLQHS